MSVENARVLVVDDIAEARYAKARALKKAGWTVLEAATGEQASDIISSGSVDLVVLDVMLPDILGTEICRKIKLTRPEIAVLQTSATFIHADDKASALDLGADAYLVEPAEAPVLVSTVRALLRSKCAEDQLRAANERLTARTAELEKAEASLRHEHRLKNKFIAMLAHELRNPLAPLHNALQIIDGPNESLGKFDERELKLFSIMRRQIKHLIRLVDELLDISRITNDKIELSRERLDLRTILQDVFHENRAEVESKGHQLFLELPSHPMIVYGDAVRIAQIVVNLLNNAAKYTDSGGTIWLKSEQREQAAVVSVVDNGIGIDPKMLPSIFDFFVQISDGAQRGGLGVGLALVKRLVELHGGSVEAQSEGLGRGSTFTVCLPLATEFADAEVNDAPAPTLRDCSSRVLVIDDNQDVANSMVMLLESLGATAQVAYEGAEGLKIVSAFRPDIVFVDIGMPGWDGLETARRIRELPEGRNVTLVALTGWGQKKTCVALGKQGSITTW